MENLDMFDHNREQMFVAQNEYERFVSDLFKPMPRKIDCILHAAVGISGEVGELIEGLEKFEGTDPREDDNTQEELGDIRFYITAAAHELSVSVAWLQEQDVPTEFDDEHGLSSLIVYSAQLLDYVKKAWAYSGELKREESVQALCQIWQAYKRTCDNLDLNDVYIRYVNVGKLSKRYPLGKYCDSDALARADKAIDVNEYVSRESRATSAILSFEQQMANCNEDAPEDVIKAVRVLKDWLRLPHDHRRFADNVAASSSLSILNAWGAL